MNNRVFIIAEAGVNHNGSIETAKQLINAAKDAGADAVKFQTFKAENLVTKHAPKAEYQRVNTLKNESQLEMLKRLELDETAHKELMDYCHNIGTKFISSPFDLESIDLLNRLGLETFKIGSGEITDLPLLRKIGSLNKKVIMSTGMAVKQEIDAALEILVNAGTPKGKISLLYCVTEYPAPPDQIDLYMMSAMRGLYGIEVGYSDHTQGDRIALEAVRFGASIIEKHFTLDSKDTGPDHKASLTPKELSMMVTTIREIENRIIRGEDIQKRLDKRPTESELKNIAIVRKSIVASRDIKEGEPFTEDNITTKRPGTGISPMKWDNVLGMKAKRDFKEDELIEI